MYKQQARRALCLILLSGLTLNLVCAGVALFGGVIYVNNLVEIFVALAAVYAPNLALLIGALKGEKGSREKVAESTPFRVAVISVSLWNCLLIARIAWFASTAWTPREDLLKHVIEFWAVVGGSASTFVTGPLAFYLGKKDL